MTNEQLANLVEGKRVPGHPASLDDQTMKAIVKALRK